MRIALIAWRDVRHESGVLKKMVEHLNHWIAMGHEVCLFVLGPSDTMWPDAGNLPYELFCSRSLWTRFSQTRRLVRSVLAWKPDIAFFRFGAYFPAFNRLLKRVPTVIELNTDDLVEYKGMLPRYQYLYHRLTRGLLLKRSAGFVSVTHELVSRYTHYKKPTIVVSNGIDLEQYPELPPTTNPRPRLLFIGSPKHIWYGEEKIVELARQVPQWDFDFVGHTKNDLGPNLPSNITAHGFLPRQEYERIMAQADAALGSLSLYVNSMNEACNLKVREYLAYGIPTIIGYRDTDFSEPTPFILELPNTLDNVRQNLASIKQFVETWKGKRLDRRKILHLDSRLKEQARLNFFEQVLQRAKAWSKNKP